MYHKYFGLEESAFSIAVNPRYLYMSRQHKEALAHLLYGVQGGGFVMLSGEVGTGKTTIIRCLLDQLPPNTEIALVLNPMADALEILGTVCDELDIEYDKQTNSIKVLTDALQERLLENHRDGWNTVLLIDEAQLMSADVLEQIRLLTNLETNTEKLLQIVLVGQPELNALLAQPRLRQLSQRITARFHLKPLSIDETSSYISHRLSVAGMPTDRNPFTPRIIKRVHAFTGGIPRKINILCERILIGAYGYNQTRVDNKIFQVAKSEVSGYSAEDKKSDIDRSWKIAAIAAASALCLLLVFWFFSAKDPALESAIEESQKEQSQSHAKEVPPVSNVSTPALDIPPDYQQTTTPALSEPNEAATQYFSTSPSAHAALFKYLDINITAEDYPCWRLAEQYIECKRVNFSSWDEFLEINRPAVLTLTGEDKFVSYALVISVFVTGSPNSYSAKLLDTHSNEFTVPLEELGPLWAGEAFYLWRRPKGFTETLKRGQRNNVVAWLAQQFAILDEQDTPLTKKLFNQKLEQRVKMFQRANNLADDGIVGEQTLMKLNDVLGIDKTLAPETDTN